MFTNDYQSYLITIYIIFFAASFVFSLIINSLLLKFVNTLGIRNPQQNNTVIRWSSQSKPSLGGIGFYIIFLLSFTSYTFFFEYSSFYLNKQFIGILFASTIGFMTGLFDDAYDTRPILKLISQIACAIILILSGNYIQIFSSILLNYFITVFWVVGMMNSINMIDNMDGISTIISISVIGGVLSMIFIDKDLTNPHIILLIGICSALFGFLFYNWNPSKIYMGDTGSQFLGVFLAAIGIIYCWNLKSSDGHLAIFPSKQIIIALLSFSLPIIDTTTVFIKRILQKKSPFVGGKDHTTHHLSYLGFNDRQVAIIISILSFISVFLSVVAAKLINKWSLLIFIFFSLYLLALFGVLFYISNKNIKH